MLQNNKFSLQFIVEDGKNETFSYTWKMVLCSNIESRICQWLKLLPSSNTHIKIFFKIKMVSLRCLLYREGAVVKSVGYGGWGASGASGSECVVGKRRTTTTSINTTTTTNITNNTTKHKQIF